MSEEQRSFVYRIDGHHRIYYLSPEWLSFAHENDAPELTADSVMGRSIYKFIEGSRVRRLYRALFQKATETGSSITVPFRCDGPHVRRFMELWVTPWEEGVLELEGRLLKQEERSVEPLLASTTDRSKTVLDICSWCKKILVSKEWLEVEEAVRRLGLFNGDKVPRLVNGTCPSCEELVFQELL